MVNINELRFSDMNKFAIASAILEKNDVDWNCDFSIDTIQQIAAHERNSITDSTGKVLFFPLGASTLAVNAEGLTKVKLDDDYSFWQYIHNAVIGNPGFGKWFCLSMLGNYASMNPSEVNLIGFLESLNGKETAAFCSLLYGAVKLDPDALKSIDLESLSTLISKAIEVSLESESCGLSYIPACNYFFNFLGNMDDLRVVMNQEPLGLQVRIANSNDVSSLPLIMNVLLSRCEREGKLYSSLDPLLIERMKRLPQENPKHNVIDKEWSACLQSIDEFKSGGIHIIPPKEAQEIIESNIYNVYDFEPYDKEHDAASEFSKALTPYLNDDNHNVYNAISLLNEDYPLTREGVDKYLEKWKEEIIGGSAMRRVMPQYQPSAYGRLLLRGLALRITINENDGDLDQVSHYAQLHAYAAVKMVLSAHNFLISCNLDHLGDHRYFSQGYEHDSIGIFMKESGLAGFMPVNLSMAQAAFNELGPELQTLTNKRLMGVKIEAEDIRKSTPIERRRLLSSDMSL